MFVSYRNGRNAPFTAIDSAGKVVFFPAFGTASGDFVGDQLEMLRLFSAATSNPLVEDSAPVNTALPTITGTAQVGETLTVTNGTWTGNPAPTFSYQWYADETAIDGANGTSYTPITDDIGKTITVEVTATNIAGSDSATSAATDAVEAAFAEPVNTALPTITGTAQVGETLTVANGTWTGNPEPTFTHLWQIADDAESEWQDILSATGTTYDIVEDDVGKVIRCVVTGSNSVGSANASSAATDAVEAAA